jgi:hypothetical protein
VDCDRHILAAQNSAIPLLTHALQIETVPDDDPKSPTFDIRLLVRYTVGVHFSYLFALMDSTAL